MYNSNQCKTTCQQTLCEVTFDKYKCMTQNNGKFHISMIANLHVINTRTKFMTQAMKHYTPYQHIFFICMWLTQKTFAIFFVQSYKNSSKISTHIRFQNQYHHHEYLHWLLLHYCHIVHHICSECCKVSSSWHMNKRNTPPQQAFS